MDSRNADFNARRAQHAKAPETSAIQTTSASSLRPPRTFLVAKQAHVLVKMVLRLAVRVPGSDVAEGLARLDDSVGFPPSFDFNYKRETSIKNGTATNDENARGDPMQRPAVSSEVTSTIPGHPPVLSSACQEEIKAPHPSPSDADSTPKLPVPEFSLRNHITKSTVSYAKAALTSLADDLEFDESHLAQAEADDMLAELQALRSTVGSRASLFTKPSAGSVRDPDAWYGEACLIDALMGLLRKRFPIQRGEHLEFSGFEPGKEGKKTEAEKQRKVNKSQGHRSGNTEWRKGREMQSEGEDESKNGRTTSGSHRSGHVKPAPSIEPPSPASDRYHKIVPTTREVIYSVTNGLSRELQDFSSSQIDTLLGRLKRRREKVIATGHRTIMSSRYPSFDASLTELREYTAEEKAQVNAHVALVDGIMLAIRQQCNSSQSPLTENSCYTWSDYASERDESIRDKMSPLIFSRRSWSGGPDMSFTSRQE